MNTRSRLTDLALALCIAGTGSAFAAAGTTKGRTEAYRDKSETHARMVAASAGGITTPLAGGGIVYGNGRARHGSQAAGLNLQGIGGTGHGRGAGIAAGVGGVVGSHNSGNASGHTKGTK